MIVTPTDILCFNFLRFYERTMKMEELIYRFCTLIGTMPYVFQPNIDHPRHG